MVFTGVNCFISRKRFRFRLFIVLSMIAVGLISVLFASSVGAIAKQSTLTIDISSHTVLVNIPPGTFGKSSDVTVDVSTDNFTGYTLSLIGAGSTSLISENDDEIESLSAAVDETTFSTNSNYDGKWGYKPSQYITTSNNINTVVQNTNFLPVPDTTGDILDITSAANSQDNEYTISFGAKVGLDQPVGAYTYSYNIVAVANSIVYNVTYDDNTSETVTNMPNPNPQALTLAGGTPVAASYATLDDVVPIMTSGDPILSFGGWCDVATTINSTTNNYECSGTTYEAGDDYSIDQTVDGTNITLYAIWLVDPFPMVWNQLGKCVFNNGTISGSECQDYVNDNYIDTGIALYSNDNNSLDYEVHFTLDTYAPGSQPDSQSTIFNDKLSSSVTDSPWGGKSPGIIVRRNGSKAIEIKSSYGAPTEHAEIRYVEKTPATTAYNGTDISIFRIDGYIYTSVDGGPLILLQDHNPFDQQFGLNAWFGAYPDNVNCTENCTAAKRYFTGEMSNMYIKLGDLPTSRLHQIEFDGNSGTPATTSYLVLDGNALNELPEVTNTGWLFDGWYTQADEGQQITAATVPTADAVYYAHWYLSVADAQIDRTDFQIATGETGHINILNASDIEPYTLVSNDVSVATVDQSTGIITAVGNGSTTITMTGTKTGDTRTIDVAVGDAIAIYFDSQGGTVTTYDWSIISGNSFHELPAPTKNGYTFEGWYTGLNGTGTKLTTSTVIDENSPDLYYANWEAKVYTCKIATTLHKEACGQTGSNGCKGAGYGSGDIQYGSFVNSTTLTAGNAYTCDINYDEYYDEASERFYYFGSADNKASLIYYKSMQDTSSIYDDALALLPTAADPGWDNPNLVTFSTTDYNNTVARIMTYDEALALCDNTGSDLGVNGRCLYLLEQSAFANSSITDGIWLEKQPSYNNRIQTRTRQLTHGNTTSNAVRPTIEVPVDQLEPYVDPSSTYEITYNPRNGSSNFTETVTLGSALGNKYPSTDPTYTDYIFQGWYTAIDGGTLVTDQTVPDGDWTYYAQWKGSVAQAQVEYDSVLLIVGNTTTVPISNAADLESFTYSSSDSGVVLINPSTGVVTGVSAGTATISITGNESHTTKSDIVTITVVDASSTFRVTFDPQNGDSTFYRDVLAGNTIDALMPQDPTYANHAFIRWYDTSNNATVTSATEPMSAMTVNAEWKLDVTQAIISNDLILAVGDQITVVVGNSAQVEPYTFSSSDNTVATVDASTGVVTGVGVGTANIILTGTRSGLTKTVVAEVTAAPVLKRTVTFNANGGTTPTPSDTYQIDDGSAVGSLPTTTKTNYMFFGWYTDDGTFYNEVTPDTVVDADVTYYAKWVENTSSFPIIWAEVNACTFDGTNNVTGDYCSSDNKTKKYIDTTKQLFIQENYYKDFEVGYTVVEYDPADNGNQATFVNSKQENSSNNYPGFVVRRYTTTDDIEITEKWKGNSGVSERLLASSVKTVRIVRRVENINNNYVINMYYSINGGTLTPLQDISNVTHIFFDTAVWFGASANSSNNMQRPLVGTLTDMYVKLGANTSYVINFNVNGGSFTNSSDASRTIQPNDPLGSLPVPNPPSNNHTFIGWFDESTTPATQVPSSTVPSGSTTYVAHYSYASSDTPVVFDVSNDATRGYKNLLSTWVASPIEITTFNEASPINNSTWGDTTELSELQYWNAIRSNFINNGCMIKTNSSYNTNSDATKPMSALSAWTSGSVDCSKPDVYDTNIGAPLTVRLDNAQGAVVSYAKADSGVIHNMIPGQTYYWEKSDDSTVYGYVTATSGGSSTGTRWVDTGVIRNTRDLGGLPVTYADANNQTVTGTLAYGRLFRGEKLQNASTTELTNLGITTEYNVGDEYSSDTHLTDYHLNTVIHYNFNYNSGDELNNNSNYMKAWTAVTNIMTDITNTNTTKNIYFHCRVGADRTGTIAYLLEGLLGVPDEQRYQEYGLTNLSGLYDRTRYYKEKVGGSTSPTLKFVYMMGYVLHNSDIYDWYMQNPNADADLIQAFRTAMTVPSNQQQNGPSNSPSSQQNSPLLDNNSGQLNSSSNTQSNSDNSGAPDYASTQSAEYGSPTYTAPLGVMDVHESTSNVGSPALVGLAAAAGVALVSGTALFSISKYRKDQENSAK